MKILFFMLHGGYVRNFESTLRTLADRGHEIHIAVDKTVKKNQPGHASPLLALADDYPAVTHGSAPMRSKTDWGVPAIRLRAMMDYLRYLEPEYEQAPKLRTRAERNVPKAIRVVATLRIIRVKGRLRRFRRAVRLALEVMPGDRSVKRYIADQAPDVVVVTPLVEMGSPQSEYVRCARELGISSCLAVSSWDNLTNKGLIQEVPDLVTVWNETQLREATDLHAVPASRVLVSGAVAYDHWFRWKPTRDRQAFCAKLGLDPERPFVLYVGSSGFIAPGEAAFVMRWIKSLRRLGGPELERLQLLVRPHPTNPLRGEEDSSVALGALEDVVVYPPDGANPTDQESRNDYFDSIYHCAAVMGVNTSAFIESSIVGRPILTVLAPEYWESQRGTLHFHYLLPANGGMLHVASSFEDHVDQLAGAVSGNGTLPDQNPDFVAHFVRPFGLEEEATPRLVSAIEQLGSRPAEPTEPRSFGQRLLGMVIAMSARAFVRHNVRKARVEKFAGRGAAKSKRSRKAKQQKRAEKTKRAKDSKSPPPEPISTGRAERPGTPVIGSGDNLASRGNSSEAERDKGSRQVA